MAERSYKNVVKIKLKVTRVCMLFCMWRFVMEEKSNVFLETESIGKLMRKYARPCVISLLVAALYNIVDQCSAAESIRKHSGLNGV